ncbi:hypothetical protein PIB30_042023 [Stylosanthes scabra]|uniref:Putative plant transposon protein domain-containing protein n=1 Tax=Stylosanthes scabra TaxID=79078 RepID=A0ABU6UH51_9FABA|nr:hypothetical protein [Stylosanthes scabra]
MADALALGALGPTTGRIACSHPSDRAPMSRRGKQAAANDATPSRVRSSRNSSRGRDEGFPANRFDHQLHFDRWKGLENRDIVHERIVRLDGDERRVFQERILGLGWGFMYEDLISINVSMVREFCTNFSSAKQDHVFHRGKRIPFTETDIRCYLNIPEEAPDADQDDNFVALVKAYERGDDMNMAKMYSVIGREETNWVNDPANNTIPKSINNGILNPQATAWHKIINANIDPKTHGTNFNMKHALVIYVLMAGVTSLDFEIEGGKEGDGAGAGMERLLRRRRRWVEEPKRERDTKRERASSKRERDTVGGSSAAVVTTAVQRRSRRRRRALRRRCLTPSLKVLAVATVLPPSFCNATVISNQNRRCLRALIRHHRRSEERPLLPRRRFIFADTGCSPEKTKEKRRHDDGGWFRGAFTAVGVPATVATAQFHCRPP